MNLEEKLSPVVRNLAPSGIRRFFDLVNQKPDAISLGVGEPDFVTPWHVREACVASLEKGMTTYTSNQGMPELVRAICKYLHQRFSLSYHDREVLVTFGASEAIDLALRTVISAGDEVLIPEPCYVSYTPCVQLAGGKPVPVSTSAQHGFKLRAESLAKAITPRSKVLILCYPNNPTGAIMSKEDLAPIVELAKKHELIVISDEIYAELTYHGEHTSIASFPGMKEHVILISGFSKAFAMTGWRIGYVAAPDTLLSGMLKIHQYTALCAPITSQVAALEALTNGMEECLAMASQYDRRRRLVVKAFQDMGLTCPDPQGAFYVFPSIEATGLDAQMFAEELLYEESVAVVPGNVFGPSGRGHIRCSYATSIERLGEALTRIERFVRKKREQLPKHSHA
ncbi:aminotransferase class I/II-fold pyridoxal phosphate-dependent enzyme [Paenactinomyces guangxiensis]|uniref:Aminotransferase n=1 Tax=Paenactinomyces guangxiensis TaxID=1490290 RepID=A0A7W1WT62_9BACL|nr:aminotransferase class I/II-fold pyridoxal phosphate-dependent enzyme [Paenactinomyces guangxiensis]MBA4495522.1 aminotransferase class I/II-fold pyridoxal phosphate-dependent enzyme [Paenactinomyces guangxiensis]MBH8592780.1 aminotransferase class I/II-fold pyridoxal phosphate-dependent enzyme [Paenactinomyces guangxiensis]